MKVEVSKTWYELNVCLLSGNIYFEQNVSYMKENEKHFNCYKVIWIKIEDIKIFAIYKFTIQKVEL